MKRIDFLKQAALLSAGITLFPKTSLFRRSNFTELRGGTGIFTMQGGTIGWLVTDDGVVVVDAQFPDSAAEFVSGISDYGSGAERILFNTHHHGDHTGGNGIFSENRYTIIAHQNVPELQMENAQAGTTPTTASVTYDDEYTLELGGETIRTGYYGRGHTRGDSVIWFENANVVHMGDLMFNRSYPFIDINGGASVENWISLLETVAKEAESDTIFIFGHGNPEFGVTGQVKDLLHKRDFLTHLYEYTKQGTDSGKSLDELKDIQGFDQFPDHISPNNFLSLPNNIEAVYQEITSS